ncbi:response regulator transcription factor [Paucihalobacter sp.]|uniref:response regulator transcription factor n=1 Tax=Paucihalobacter sp. TaxID=2850405 RepID=UPI002FE14D3D
MRPTIVIADDHPLMLKGLTEFLSDKNFDIVAQAKNGKEAMTLIRAHKPDIAILDIQMPIQSGLDVASICKHEGIETKLIILTFEKHESTFKLAQKLGVYGYILKEFALLELETCIHSALNGKTHFPDELKKSLEVEQVPEKIELLTPTEKIVVSSIGKNKTAKEIADELNISVRTVEKHKSHIRTKLNLDSSYGALIGFAKEFKDFLK